MRTTAARIVAFAVILLCSATAAMPAAAAPDPLLVTSSFAQLGGFAPGDSTEWTAQTENRASEPLPLQVTVEATGADVLATDPTDGLQLAVDLCDARYDATAAPARYRCPATDVALGAGPAATIGRLEASRTIAAGATTAVRVRIHFPESAGNAFENSSAGLKVTFTVAGGSAPTPEGPLAVTGSDIRAALLGGLAALLVGSLALAVARRRREPAR